MTDKDDLSRAHRHRREQQIKANVREEKRWRREQYEKSQIDRVWDDVDVALSRRYATRDAETRDKLTDTIVKLAGQLRQFGYEELLNHAFERLEEDLKSFPNGVPGRADTADIRELLKLLRDALKLSQQQLAWAVGKVAWDSPTVASACRFEIEHSQSMTASQDRLPKSHDFERQRDIAPIGESKPKKRKGRKGNEPLERVALIRQFHRHIVGDKPIEDEAQLRQTTKNVRNWLRTRWDIRYENGERWWDSLTQDVQLELHELRTEILEHLT